MRTKFRILVCVILVGSLIVFSKSNDYEYNVDSKGCIPVNFKPAPEHSPLQLVRNGKINFAVICDINNARVEKSVKKGAEYLVDSFFYTCGEKPEIFDISEEAQAKSRYPYLMILGDNVISRRLGVDASHLPEQGFETKTFSGGIVIAGHDSDLYNDEKDDVLNIKCHYRGTIWGVVDFTERFLGVRVYFPGPYGFTAPKISSLEIRPVHYADKPRFINRDSYIYYIDSLFQEQGGKWKTLFGMDGAADEKNYPDIKIAWRLDWPDKSFHPGHNPNPQRILKWFPDRKKDIFFTAPNGYMYYNPMAHYGNDFDMTNLDFADIIIEALKGFYASNGRKYDIWITRPNRRFVNLGQCDQMISTLDLEQTPIVRKLNLITEADKRANRPQSQIYARFTSYFARRVKEEFPQLKVAFMPYQGSVKPPLDKQKWKFPDNVILRHCAYDLPALAGNDRKIRETLNEIKEWSEMIGGRPIESFFFYHVPENTGSPFVRAVASEYMGLAIRKIGKYIGNYGVFYFQYPKINFSYYYSEYCAAKSFWNPDFDVAEAIDEHWVPFYGREAGLILKEFHTRLQACYKKYFLYADTGKNCNPIYPPKELDSFERLLKQAEEALRNKPDSVEMKRFQIFARPWKKAIETQRNRQGYECPIYHVNYVSEEDMDASTKRPVPAFWDKIHPMKMIDPNGSGKKLSYAPDFRLAWNPQGIHGLMTAPFRPRFLGENPGIKKNDLDNIELFFSPGLKGEKYYQFVLDTTGEVFSLSKELLPVQSPENKAWRAPGFRHNLSVSDSFWKIDFFVPFADLKVKKMKPYQCWKANFIMNKLVAPAEYSANSMCLGRNNNLPMYGILKFDGREVNSSEKMPDRYIREQKNSGGDVTVIRKEKTNVWRKDDYSNLVYYSFGNSLNQYDLGILTKKPFKTQPPVHCFRLDAPKFYGNYARPILDFFKLEINDIPLAAVNLDYSKMKIYQKDNDEAGIVFPVNFDGVLLNFRFFMKKDSPVLWLELKKNSGSTSAFEYGKLEVLFCPSQLKVLKGQGKFSFEDYRRQVRTDTRIINQSRKNILLTAEDRYLIFRDLDLTGSPKIENGKQIRNGSGPGYLYFQSAAAKNMTLQLGGANCRFSMILGEDFQSVILGFWQQKNDISNQDFDAKFNRNKASFMP